jgi:aldos-2-ulose dehydratase/isomerase family protein/VCBS repeat protein
LKGMINVAYWNDQIVLASDFSSDPKKSIGLVTLLVPDSDPRRPWRAREIDRLTTSHRLRWADIDGTGKKVLVNAPLAGAKAEPPDYRDPVPLVFYRPPEWKRELISNANVGVQHGVLIIDWDGDKRDEILTASFSGIDLYRRQNDGYWKRTEIARGDPDPCPKCGSSDIAVGHLGNERFITAIEPWHGNELAIYRRHGQAWQRDVIDSSLVAGHTLVTADLDGDKRDEIVAGYRGNGGSVLLYHADAQGHWTKSVMDPHIPANACLVTDLNGDRRPDIACIGGPVLKWYENR